MAQPRATDANKSGGANDGPRIGTPKGYGGWREIPGPRSAKTNHAGNLQQLISTHYLTAEQAAAILKVSTKTIIRKFEKRPVIDLGNGEGRFKQRYRVLRIPRETFEKFIAEKRVQ